MEQYNTAEQERLRRLLIGYIRNQLNEQEIAEMMHWTGLTPLNQKLLDELSDDAYRKRKLQEMGRFDVEASLLSTKNRLKRTKRHILYRYIAVAASFVLIVSAAVLIFKNRYTQPNAIVLAESVGPGGNKAVLTLSNGKTVDLTAATIGNIAVLEGIKITKATEGLITYQATAQGETIAPGTNTITTPNGGQYKVVLPDGTQVWLNAASSLTYPVAFNGKQRSVRLTGEAYFEVAAQYTNQINQKIPFIVTTYNQHVKVLGTHFNINAYHDESATITTLEEGAVQVTAGAQKWLLRPGQKTVNQQGTVHVTEADLRTELGWKEGKIYFRDADIKTIMRQVGRWYDIDIAYEGKISKKLFNGGVSRSSNLATLLKILEESNIHFTIGDNGNGRKKLTVMPDR